MLVDEDLEPNVKSLEEAMPWYTALIRRALEGAVSPGRRIDLSFSLGKMMEIQHILDAFIAKNAIHPDTKLSELSRRLGHTLNSHLDNWASGLELPVDPRLTDAKKRGGFKEPSFRCIEDFEKCRKEKRPSWLCLAALIICWKGASGS